MKIKIRSAGIREILKSSRVKADMHARAARIADAAQLKSTRPDAHFAFSSRVGKTRARASVITANHSAHHEELHRMALTKSMDAGR